MHKSELLDLSTGRGLDRLTATEALQVLQSDVSNLPPEVRARLVAIACS